MKISFYLPILFFCINIKAQTLVDSSYKTTYYEQKVTLHSLLPKTRGDIVFLGNSITDIGEWAEIWNNKKVKNRGISGDNTFGVLARLYSIVATKPSKIFIMIGINDIARQTPDSIIISNYIKILSFIKNNSPITKIVVQSILPTNNDFKEFVKHQNKETHIKYLNTALQNYCEKNSLVYVELHDAFLDENNKLNKKYTNDGLHINGYGYMLWKKILKKKRLMY